MSETTQGQSPSNSADNTEWLSQFYLFEQDRECYIPFEDQLDVLTEAMPFEKELNLVIDRSRLFAARAPSSVVAHKQHTDADYKNDIHSNVPLITSVF
jgi:hypothetical protein